MIPVQSSNVAAIGYDDTVRLLRIAFKDGSVYDGVGVDPAVHSALMATSSKGSFIAQYLSKVLQKRPALQHSANPMSKPKPHGLLHTHEPDDCCKIGQALHDGKVRGDSWICKECGMEWRPRPVGDSTLHWEPHPCIMVFRR